MTKKQLIKNYEELICSNLKVDPEQEYTWEALFVGMAVAYGFKPERAREIYMKDEVYRLEGETTLIV